MPQEAWEFVFIPLQEEGIVIKDLTSQWKPADRSDAWFKIKPGVQNNQRSRQMWNEWDLPQPVQFNCVGSSWERCCQAVRSKVSSWTSILESCVSVLLTIHWQACCKGRCTSVILLAPLQC